MSPRIVLTPPQPTSGSSRLTAACITRWRHWSQTTSILTKADELDANKRHKRNVILGVLGALRHLALAGFAITDAQQPAYLVPQFVGQTDQATRT